MKKELKESISNLLGEEATSGQIIGLNCLLDYITALEERVDLLSTPLQKLQKDPGGYYKPFVDKKDNGSFLRDTEELKSGLKSAKKEFEKEFKEHKIMPKVFSAKSRP